jgi:hypothetical protein
MFSRKFETATAVRDGVMVLFVITWRISGWLSLIFGVAILIQNKAIVRCLIAAGALAGSPSVISDRHQFSLVGFSWRYVLVQTFKLCLSLLWFFELLPVPDFRCCHPDIE